MSVSWRLLLSLAIVAGATQVAATTGSDAEALANNRKLLEKWRADPEHYARLKRDWRAFRSLPVDKQARIRQLDQDLHQQPVEVQANLRRVLERYAAWLEHLPEDDQRQIELAPDSTQRLQAVVQIREREWLARLPRATRERVQRTPAGEQAVLISQLRKQERQHRQEWQRTLKRREPRGPTDLPPEVRRFVNESLRPLLNDTERRTLLKAENTWSYGATVRELAERNPIKMPPALQSHLGPRSIRDLKQRDDFVIRYLDDARLRQVEGKWPDFALYVTEVAKAKQLTLPPQGPSRPEHFVLSVRQFISAELLPLLDDNDQLRLRSAEGKWPEYPQTLMELANKHKLRVPGTTLPAPEFWESLRSDLPNPTDRGSRESALTRQPPEELAGPRPTSAKDLPSP